jgi:hypothetical protein
VKRAKTVGSLAIVAVFAMALIGPSLAMGEDTALCEADESQCTSPVSHVHYVAEDIFILGPYNYHCDALLLASVGELGSPQVLEGNLTYFNCSGGCARTEISEGGTLSFLRTGVELAEVTGEGFEILSSCGGSFHCVYTFENLTGHAVDPLLSTANNGEITYIEQPLNHVSGFFCPKETKLDATFVPLSETYISS